MLPSLSRLSLLAVGVSAQGDSRQNPVLLSSDEEGDEGDPPQPPPQPAAPSRKAGGKSAREDPLLCIVIRVESSPAYRILGPSPTKHVASLSYEPYTPTGVAPETVASFDEAFEKAMYKLSQAYKPNLEPLEARSPGFPVDITMLESVATRTLEVEFQTGDFKEGEVPSDDFIREFKSKLEYRPDLHNEFKSHRSWRAHATTREEGNSVAAAGHVGTDASRPPEFYFGYYQEIDGGSIFEQRPFDRDGNEDKTRPTRGEVFAQLTGDWKTTPFNFSNNCNSQMAIDDFIWEVKRGRAVAVVFTAEGEALSMISLRLESSVTRWRENALRLWKRLEKEDTETGDKLSPDQLALEVDESGVAFKIGFACSSGGFGATRPDGSNAWRGSMRYLLCEMANVIRALYKIEEIPDRLFLFTLSSMMNAVPKWVSLKFLPFGNHYTHKYYLPVFLPLKDSTPFPEPKEPKASRT